MKTDPTQWSREELDTWFTLVHRELRALAASQRRRRGRASDAGTTSLLHLAYERMARSDTLVVRDVKHFFALTARIMRQILINQAHALQTSKRGGDAHIYSLEELEPWLQGRFLGEEELVQMLDLEEALEALSQEDEELVELVEHHIHLGMTLNEYAELRQVSLSTVKRKWRLTRAYLSRALENSGP